MGYPLLFTRSLIVRNGAVPRLNTWLLVSAVLLGRAGPAPAQTPARVPACDVVFVADGAGNYQIASKSLRGVVALTNAPLDIVTFVWSHGYKKILPDQTDLAHARQQGWFLANTVMAYRQAHPGAKIRLAGHSAGSMVVLSATEFLPPQTLEHIVLLAPSVSTVYDIRPALRSVRGTVEVHYSREDWVYLGFCTRVLGCADRVRADASGRVGFELCIESDQDAALLPRLVQHPWQPAFRELGNDGGHFGAYQLEYLRTFVLPVLLGH
jgi:pimeloyl-ACP methyl ester carboxylesterase